MDLLAGSRGQFDVFVDDELVASKQQASRLASALAADGFPEVEATVAVVATRLGAD